MRDLDAILLIEEGKRDPADEAVVAAWQHLINTGLVWQLQGWFARRAIYLIEQGVCKMSITPEGKGVPNEQNETD